MTTNCRSQFTAYLRQRKIQYTIYPSLVSIGFFHFFFDDSTEYITISFTPNAEIRFNIPYSTPQTIIDKWQAFRNMIARFSNDFVPHFLENKHFSSSPLQKRTYKKRIPATQQN